MMTHDSILELIRLTSTDLSRDVEAALARAKDAESEGSAARTVMENILRNVELARKLSTPICQDTGSLIFYIDYPQGEIREHEIRSQIEAAAIEATARHYLRPNAVDPITGRNSGNNVGKNAPYVHFHQWTEDYTRVRLMLKGGGSENVGIQYKLPDSSIGAGRDLKGIKKCIIDAVVKAQGFGCAPGAVGVGVGGDRATSYILSKEQFFRNLGEPNPDPALQEVESEMYEKLNRLEIGPMGFGGKTTVLGVLVGCQHRHPATFYVAVSYMCWVYRRHTMVIRGNEVSYD